jgi:hypothetical protein
VEFLIISALIIKEAPPPTVAPPAGLNRPPLADPREPGPKHPDEGDADGDEKPDADDEKGKANGQAVNARVGQRPFGKLQVIIIRPVGPASRPAINWLSPSKVARVNPALLAMVLR